MEARDLSRIPKEIWLTMIYYLDVKDILMLEMVCKFFQEFFQENEVWRKIYKQRTPTFFAQKKIAQNENPNWRDRFLESSTSKPNLDLALIFITLYEQYLKDTRTHKLQRTMLGARFYHLNSSDLYESKLNKYFFAAVTAVTNEFNEQTPNWLDLIKQLRKYAEECNQLKDSGRTTLGHVLHGTASYLIILLRGNYSWEKSTRKIKDELKNAIAEPDATKATPIAFNLLYISDQEAIEYLKRYPEIKFNEAVTDPSYYKKVYELFKMFTQKTFEEYVDAFLKQKNQKRLTT